MSGNFLQSMAAATPQVLRSFPWPSQDDITKRKDKLKAITARLFAAASEAGTTDVDKILKESAELRGEVLASLTDMEAREANLTAWAGNLQKELAARTQDKEVQDTEKQKKKEAVEARKMDDKMKIEDAKRQREEDIKKGKIKALPKIGKRRHISSDESSRSRSRSYRKTKKQVEKRRTDDSDCSESDSSRRTKPKPKESRKTEPKPKKRRAPSESSDETRRVRETEKALRAGSEPRDRRGRRR